jgi:hypothetical protein
MELVNLSSQFVRLLIKVVLMGLANLSSQFVRFAELQISYPKSKG